MNENGRPWTVARFPIGSPPQLPMVFIPRCWSDCMHFLCAFLCNKRSCVPCPNSAFYSSPSEVKTYHKGLQLRSFSFYFRSGCTRAWHRVDSCTLMKKYIELIWNLELRIVSVIGWKSMGRILWFKVTQFGQSNSHTQHLENLEFALGPRCINSPNRLIIPSNLIYAQHHKMNNIVQYRKSIPTAFDNYSPPKNDFVSKIIVLVLPSVESDVYNVAKKMLTMHFLQLF